jgi:hypothetical protein
MRTIITACLFVSVFVPTPSMADQTRDGSARRPLFDGKSLDGWEHVGPRKMVLDDAVLRTEGGMGLLWYTRETFGDRALRVLHSTVPERTKEFEPKRGPRPESGYIGLQNHDDYGGGGAHVEFKEVSVRPIAAADREPVHPVKAS